MARRVTIRDIAGMKVRGEKIPMVTAYDYPTARLADEAKIPMVLVGDSLGMVVLGYDSTIPVTMEEMVHHCKAVGRGSQRAMIVGDLPFMSYQANVSDALYNAGRLLKEGGVQAVKLEGGARMAETVGKIVECGIPVMGHIGLTPQSVNRFGGYRVRGKEKEEAVQLIRDAVALEEAGVFALVLELVPAAPRGHHHQAPFDPHHRNRGGAPLRWPGTGPPRHAGPLPRLRAQACQAVRGAGGAYIRRPEAVRGGGPGRHLPRPQGELRHG